MKLYHFFLILLVCILVGCGECSKDADCAARHAFSVSCVDGECVYSPIPNMIGNGICEEGENKCTAPMDCGQCVGKLPGSKYLVQSCIEQQCVPDVLPSMVEPVYLVKEAKSGAEQFQVEVAYSSPFNMRKDVFQAKVSLVRGDDVRIHNVELKASTPDRRTVILSDMPLNRPVWSGYPVVVDLPLDFPSPSIEGELSNLVLTVRYAAGSAERSFIARLDDLTYVRPDVHYPCPASCNDQNPGTRDYCGAQTNYFCMHDPIPGVCGNYICDNNENRCTCPVDCGPCAGGAGTYVDYACRGLKCVGVLKSGLQVERKSLFDERRVSVFDLTNTYSFNNPFDIEKDKFLFDFTSHPPSGLKIEYIRLLEQNQILAEAEISRQLPFSIEVAVPALTLPEEEHTVTLHVWYSYMQNDEEKRGQFTKPLGKITFLSVE